MSEKITRRRFLGATAAAATGAAAGCNEPTQTGTNTDNDTPNGKSGDNYTDDSTSEDTETDTEGPTDHDPFAVLDGEEVTEAYFESGSYDSGSGYSAKDETFDNTRIEDYVESRWGVDVEEDVDEVVKDKVISEFEKKYDKDEYTEEDGSLDKDYFFNEVQETIRKEDGVDSLEEITDWYDENINIDGSNPFKSSVESEVDTYGGEYSEFADFSFDQEVEFENIVDIFTKTVDVGEVAAAGSVASGLKSGGMDSFRNLFGAYQASQQYEGEVGDRLFQSGIELASGGDHGDIREQEVMFLGYLNEGKAPDNPFGEWSNDNVTNVAAIEAGWNPKNDQDLFKKDEGLEAESDSVDKSERKDLGLGFNDEHEKFVYRRRSLSLNEDGERTTLTNVFGKEAMNQYTDEVYRHLVAELNDGDGGDWIGSSYSFPEIPEVGGREVNGSLNPEERALVEVNRFAMTYMHENTVERINDTIRIGLGDNNDADTLSERQALGTIAGLNGFTDRYLMEQEGDFTVYPIDFYTGSVNENGILDHEVVDWMNNQVMNDGLFEDRGDLESVEQVIRKAQSEAKDDGGSSSSGDSGSGSGGDSGGLTGGEDRSNDVTGGSK